MLRLWFAFRRAALVFIAGGAANLIGQLLALGIAGPAYATEIESAARLCAVIVMITTVVVFLRRYEALHPSQGTVARTNQR